MTTKPGIPSPYENLIAPCGMNCGICIGYLRDRKPCCGCFESSVNKPKHCVNCAIAGCEELKATDSGYCYECTKYPCTRLKRLDKRYRTRYRMSMIENLDFMSKYGLEKFIANEEKRWKCSNCGKGICVHRDECLECGSPVITTKN
jgi:hypothetical protein